ncbi:MAG: metallophosphoesterase [Clostridia bacterium]|nr:metallophosphoesterase [Clostridia bacterium]
MRLLVISDSHKRSSIVDRIIRKEENAKHIFFLGDIVGDIEDLVYEYTDRNFYIVAGNCDYFSDIKAFDFAEISGKKILFSHGHTFGVKSGNTGTLKKIAKENGCDIALYGHTHIANIEYDDGLYLVNPGSCSHSREGAESYAVIDILPSGILPQIIKI